MVWTSVTISASLNMHKQIQINKAVNKAESKRAVRNSLEGGSEQKEGRGLQESVHSDSWRLGHVIMVWKKDSLGKNKVK